jgi:hypothetical protein
VSKTDYSPFLDLIDAGELDDMIEQLTDVVRARREYLHKLKGANNRAAMEPGDKVRLVDISPRYLYGVTGEVVDQTPKRHGDIMVRIDDRYYRGRIAQRFGRVVGVPASSLEYV